MVDQPHTVDDIPAYALGALDSAETERFLAHVADCPACQAELSAYQEVLSLISQTAPQFEPPSRLKTAILDEVKRLPQTRTLPAEKVTQNWLGKIRAWFAIEPALRLSGAFLVLILVASNLMMWQQLNTVTAMQRHGYASVLLKPTSAEPLAKGMVVYTLDGKSGFLVVNNLNPSAAGKQYQLWLVKGTQRTSGGVFSVGADGYAVMEIETTLQLTEYTGFGITIEPQGGSAGPTGPKVLGGSF